MAAFYEKPKYLSDISIEESDKENRQFEYIFSADALAKFQNEICTDIHQSTAVIEFVDNQAIIHESNVAKILYRTSCRIFRTCFTNQNCEDCDKAHACIFINNSINELSDGYVIKKGLDENIIQSYENNEVLMRPTVRSVQIDDNKTKKYIEYDCPHLGYREVIFPIEYKNEVLGVFIAGQISLNHNKSLIKKQKKKYFKNNFESLNSSFQDYKNSMVDYSNAAVTKFGWKIRPKGITLRNVIISLLHYDDTNSIKDIIAPLEQDKSIDKNDYNNLINKILNNIDNLESTISNTILDKRKDYIIKSIDTVIVDFYDEVSKIELPIKDKSKLEFWDNVVKKSLIDIKEILGLENLILFGDDEDKKDKKLKKVCNCISGSAFDSVSFDLDEMDEKEHIDAKKERSSIEKPELFDYLKIDNKMYEIDKKDKSILLYYPSPFSLNKSLALLIIFPNKYIEPKEETLRRLRDELFILMACIATVYASIDDLIESKTTENLISIYRHEISHHVQSLSTINEKFLKNYEIYKNRKEYQVNDAYRDINSTLERMLYISKNTRFIFAETEINLVPLNIYNDLLYKFRTTYRVDAETQKKDFIIPSSYERNQKKVIINTDKNMLDLIVNNLISNAVKYSYWGSKIYIDCHKESREAVYYILSVTDYGIPLFEMGKKENIYKLYQRGEIAKEVDVTGAGIGLYIIKKLCDALGYEIDFKQELVSEFHVPYVNEYIYRSMTDNSIDKGSNQYKEIYNEYKRLRLTGMFNEVLSNENSKYYKLKRTSEILADINENTYKVKAEIKIWDK